MNAVERLLVYTELPSEEPQDNHSNSPELDASWPAEGVIEFRNVDMAYREGLPLVLKDVSFHVKSGEKVCVLTGAGTGILVEPHCLLFSDWYRW